MDLGGNGWRKAAACKMSCLEKVFEISIYECGGGRSMTDLTLDMH